MGTYTDLAVAGYSLLSSKSAVVAEAVTVFRESDRRTFLRQMGVTKPAASSALGRRSSRCWRLRRGKLDRIDLCLFAVFVALDVRNALMGI